MAQPRSKIISRLLAIVVIASASALLAWGIARAPGTRSAIRAIDQSIYDACYQLREPEMQADSPVVVVEIDDASLKEIDTAADYRWPWPRQVWGVTAEKLQQMGARAVALDLLFSEKSVYGLDDDQALARQIEGLRIPIIGAVVGKEGRYAIPLTRPIPLGDTDITEGKVYRDYFPTTPRGDSLALATVKAAGLEPKLPDDRAFRLRYYGPHRTEAGRSVIPAYKASALIASALDDSLPAEKQFDPALVKDKIVLIGPIAAGLHDLKQSPISARYPGVEVHATAILNLIRGQQVELIAPGLVRLVGAIGCLLIASGVVLVRGAALKSLTIVLVVTALLAWVVFLMSADAMRWLAPTEPLLAFLLAGMGALLWIYKIEDARARYLLKALSQCIAPEVASELAADPSKLSVGGQKREMTILFTDLEGFTKLTERLGEGIEPVLNLYLAEMSQQAFAVQGTIDKYIGDAMMVFWNAPLAQTDHARRACETALQLVEHERGITPRLQELGAKSVFTRIGIHTGTAVVGFFGSRQRLTYTAVGDSVNLAARLEPSNKLYGTQILVSRDTMSASGESMLFRPIDRLRVYGRNEPVGVYELMARRADATPDQIWLADVSAQAAQAYLERDWARCLEWVSGILEKFPNDGPARMWRGRVEQYLKNPPAENWDGVFEQTSK